MSLPSRPDPLPAPLDPELAEALPAFEAFFKTFGFKRIHGRIWALLVLYGEPLSCRDVAHLLSISMGATSTTLNELIEWGAISAEFDSQRRCHVHAPVGNALSIAATVLRRREQVAFQSFKHSVQRAADYVVRRHGERDPRVLTLRSIIAACELAEALMTLVLNAVNSALGDPESVLSRAIGTALRAGRSGPAKLLWGRSRDAQRAHAAAKDAALAAKRAKERAHA